MNATVTDRNRLASDPVFKSPHEALAFGFRYSSDQYPVSALAKMIGGTERGSGRGLRSLDGAGQAGMVIAEVLELHNAAHQYALAARFAARGEKCACGSKCCSGYRRSELWDGAVAWIAEQAISELSGHISNVRLRRAIVARYFGERVNVEAMAERCKVHRNTASGQQKKVVDWLKSLEKDAMHEITNAMAKTGMV